MKRHFLKALYSLPLATLLLIQPDFAFAGGSLVKWNYPAIWSGLYAGVHIGYGKADYDGYFDAGEEPEDRIAYADYLKLNGGIGGVHIGYNWQRHNIVYGLEASISGTAIKDRATDADTTTGDSIEAEIDYLASFRGRLGIVHNKTYLYATAGLAMADASFSASDNNGTTRGKVEFEDTGYVVGGGFEKILTPEGLRLKVEGLYYKFDDTIDTSTLTADSDPGDFARFDDIWTVKVGLSVPLGGYSRRSYK